MKAPADVRHPLGLHFKFFPVNVIRSGSRRMYGAAGHGRDSEGLEGKFMQIREFFVELFTKSCVLLGWQGFVFLI